MKYEDWIEELDAEEAAHEKYRDKAQAVVDRYEDEEERSDSQFNILWSNVEVLHSALYAKAPTPDIRRRYLDNDPDGKEAAEVAERAVSYCIDTYDFNGPIDATVDDYLISGLGQCRLRYTPYFESKTTVKQLEVRPNGFDPLEMTETYGAFDGDEEVSEYDMDDMGNCTCEGDPEEELVYEEVTSESVNWKRFRYQPADCWENSDWSCIEHYMTLDEMKDNDDLKDVAEDIPLGYSDDGEKVKDDEDDKKARALVHEIFDRKNRKNIFMAEGYNEIISEQDDPLNLENYYPFPKPLVATLKNGKFIPIPDYLFYLDQAVELDVITSRIDALTNQLKYRGIYDGAFPTLQDVANSDDGEFVPVMDFNTMFDGKASLDKVIATMPLEDIQRVLIGLYKARDEIKQIIYEITGIADIMRGASNANETLGAQKLKTQFGSMRMVKRQTRVAEFVRNIIRLKVELMVENFQPETLEIMTGKEIKPEVLEILQDDMMRSYRIDIETDSTIAEDAAQEKQGRIEMMQAVTGFIEKAAPMVQAGFLPANVAKELLGFTVRGFKIGRTLEDVLDEMGGQEDDPRMKQMQQQVQGQAQQQMEQMQQQAQEYIQKMQKDMGGQIKALEGKLFESQKTLAITKAASVAKSQSEIETERIKSHVAIKASETKADIQGDLEIFKARLEAILKIPEQRDMTEVINVTRQALEEQQAGYEQRIDDLNDQLDSAKASVTEISEYQKKPVKILRDKNGRVSGATRD